MITREQIKTLVKKFKINETTIFREYLQLLFLNKLYSFSESRKIVFKGGTAVHLIFKAPRFSEDLDFTVELNQKDFLSLIKRVFNEFSKQEEVEFKDRKTITGKRFLMTASPSILPYKVFVNLDFSFREKVFEIEKSIIKVDYPIVFSSYVYHLSKQEIVAEKIRALMTRRKERDLYDLWYLLNQGVSLDNKLIKEKLDYYKLGKMGRKKIVERIESFSQKDFVLDLRPFVPLPEREKLPAFFNFIKEALKERILSK